jgi:hypothetical protein
MTTMLGGRPSKGQRKFLATRAPLPLAQEAAARADELGMSVSDYLSTLLARDLGRPEFAPKPVDPSRLELPITAA